MISEIPGKKSNEVFMLVCKFPTNVVVGDAVLERIAKKIGQVSRNSG